MRTHIIRPINSHQWYCLRSKKVFFDLQLNYEPITNDCNKLLHYGLKKSKI